MISETDALLFLVELLYVGGKKCPENVKTITAIGKWILTGILHLDGLVAWV